MGIINNLKVYIKEKKEYEKELENLENYKRKMIESAMEEVKYKEMAYRDDIYYLTKSDDVKYYAIDDDTLDFLVIVGKDGNYAELYHGVPIRFKEELDTLIANKDYKELIRAVYQCFEDKYDDDYPVGVYFVPGVIEMATQDVKEMIERACEDCYDDMYYELYDEDGKCFNQFCEIEKTIGTILEEKYFAEHPESAEILMKKRK